MLTGMLLEVPYLFVCFIHLFKYIMSLLHIFINSVGRSYGYHTSCTLDVCMYHFLLEDWFEIEKDKNRRIQMEKQPKLLSDKTLRKLKKGVEGTYTKLFSIHRVLE